MKASKFLSAISRVAIMTVSVVAATHAAATESVTNGFEPAADREYVEVNLDRSLIELAMGIVGTKEPSLAALLTGIERVNIRVIGLDESNRASSLQRIEEIRSSLESDGWATVVTASKGDNGDDVSILARMDKDAITGLVITVIDSDDEIVVLDISGQVRTEQIAELVKQLNIEGLEGLSEIMKEA